MLSKQDREAHAEKRKTAIGERQRKSETETHGETLRERYTQRGVGETERDRQTDDGEA